MSAAPSALLLEWVRDDEGGWTIPEGRPREFVVLFVGLPIFALYTTAKFDLSWPPVRYWWAVATLGVVAGYCYTVYYRDPIIASVSADSDGWTLISVFVGGAGVSLLELVPATGAVTLFLIATGASIVAIYLLRLVSPFHDGIEPARRGADPPPALEAPTA